MTDITLRSATAQLALLGQGRISAVELLELHLSRIEQINPALNAVVALDVAKARAAALASDARRRAGQAGTLEGLPITIKDAFDVAGHISTAGANAFRERVPEEDAAAVARLRAAARALATSSATTALSAGSSRSMRDR